MTRITHLSLFSGIGGLDIAAEWAGFETVGQCEIADYPYKVLCRHWPKVPKWRDIHELSVDDFRDKTGLESPTIISGGFPCQPHSLAGKRQASGDERDLWGEYRRVVSEIQPRWVVAENVRGLLTSEDGRFFRGILRDFAAMGFNAGWCTYRAADVGAIHARERVAIIAHSNGERLQGRIMENRPEAPIQQFPQRTSAWNAGCERLSCIFSSPGICGRNDGVSSVMDRDKSLGNAVVPQQFYPIFEAIANIETLDCV